jgi:hypothetical protein
MRKSAVLMKESGTSTHTFGKFAAFAAAFEIFSTTHTFNIFLQCLQLLFQEEKQVDLG